MIKIVHTADIHFGVENYGKIDPQTGLHSRLLDFVSSFNFVVDYAIKENADLFIIAGDAYKTANPTPTHQKFLLQALLKLQQAKIEVVIVVGNHDQPVSFGKIHALDVYSDIPITGFHVFGRASAKTIQTKRGPVQVVGIPWPSRQQLLSKEKLFHKNNQELTELISQKMREIIKNLAASLNPEIPAVLTGHLTVANGVFSGSEKQAVFGNDPLLFPSDLDIEPFNYVALGHLHRNQSLNLSGKTPIIYAGSIERIDFGEVRDTKGFMIAQINTEKVGFDNFLRTAETVFVPTPTRSMLQVNINLIENGEPFTKQIIDQLKTVHFENSILKIFYHLPLGVGDTVDQFLIQRHLEKVWHLTGIIPIRQIHSRTQKAENHHNNHNNCHNSQKLPQELLNIFLQKKNLSPEIQKKIEQFAEKIITNITEEENQNL